MCNKKEILRPGYILGVFMKALVIFALIFSVLGSFSLFFIGIFFSAISGILAIWACKKHIPYALVPLILNVVNLLVFSPQKLSSNTTGGMMNMDSNLLVLVLSFILPVLLIQIVGIVFYMKNVQKNKQIER